MTSANISNRQFEIIEAAGRILAESGVGGLTIKRLAQEMKFSESAIYRHFDGKEEVILAMLKFLAENMDERLSRVVSGQQHPLENLERIFLEQFAFFSKNAHFVVAVFSDGLMEESHKVNTAILQIMQVKMKHLMPVVEQGRQAGLLKNTITTEEMVHIIMGSFRLLMLKWRISNFQFDIQDQGAASLRALLTLLKN